MPSRTADTVVSAMLAIREAQDSDVPAIGDIFVAVYSSDYCFPKFYDEQSLKKTVDA